MSCQKVAYTLPSAALGWRCSLEGNWGIEREGVEEHGQRSTEALEEQDRGRGSRV